MRKCWLTPMRFGSTVSDRRPLMSRVRHVIGIHFVSTVPCSCSTPPPRPPVFQVAYTGTLPATLSSLTTSSVFNFTSDLINVGAPFTFNDGHFQAPVSGIYGLSLTAYMSSPYWVSMQLKRNSSPVLTVKTGHYTSRQLSMGTNFVLVNMTQGDEVWPAYETGSGYLWAEGISTVSAFLLYQL